MNEPFPEQVVAAIMVAIRERAKPIIEKHRESMLAELQEAAEEAIAVSGLRITKWAKVHAHGETLTIELRSTPPA